MTARRFLSNEILIQNKHFMFISTQHFNVYKHLVRDRKITAKQLAFFWFNLFASCFHPTKLFFQQLTEMFRHPWISFENNILIVQHPVVCSHLPLRNLTRRELFWNFQWSQTWTDIELLRCKQCEKYEEQKIFL